MHDMYVYVKCDTVMEKKKYLVYVLCIYDIVWEDVFGFEGRLHFSKKTICTHS